MAMSTEDRIAAQQNSATQAAAIAANGGVDPGLTRQFGITDPDLAKYLTMASMPSQIAWGDPSAGGSRSQEQAAARAVAQFAQLGGQAELDRLTAKIQTNPTLQSQLQAVTKAGNKGDFFSKIGDTVVKLTPTALKAAAMVGGADLVMGGALIGGGTAGAGVAGGTGSGGVGTGGGGGMLGAPSTVALDPIAAMTGTGTGVSDFAALNSAISAPGAMVSGSLGNATTGLGYDMLGTAATGGGMLGAASAASPAITQAAQALTPTPTPTPTQNPFNLSDPSTYPWGQVASTGLNLAGGYFQGQSATDAVRTAANAQIEAARIAADAQRLQLPNISGNMFGTNQSTYDAQGRLTGVSSTAAPWLAQQQGTLQGMTGQQLAQYQGAPAATAPMGTTAQTMFGLGQGYLQTSPQAQAVQYMSEQQALLAPTRERQMAQMLATEQARGTMGLGVGATTTGFGASNPRLEAMLNAQRQQDLQLAAQATQGGQYNAQFGSGMVGAGGQMIRDQIAAQNASFTPYGTTMTGLSNLQTLQNQPLNQSLQFGSPATAAAAAAGQYQGQGMMNAATTMQPANAYSPWATMLSNAGNALTNYQTQQTQQQAQQAQQQAQQAQQQAQQAQQNFNNQLLSAMWQKGGATV